MRISFWNLCAFLLVYLAVLLTAPLCLKFRIGLSSFTKPQRFWLLWIIVQLRKNGYFWNTVSESLPVYDYGALHLFWDSLVSLNNVSCHTWSKSKFLFCRIKLSVIRSQGSLLPTLFSATSHHPRVFPTSSNFLKCLDYKRLILSSLLLHMIFSLFLRNFLLFHAWQFSCNSLKQSSASIISVTFPLPK